MRLWGLLPAHFSSLNFTSFFNFQASYHSWASPSSKFW